MAFFSLGEVLNRVIAHRLEIAKRGLPTVNCASCSTPNSIIPGEPSQIVECEGCGAVLRLNAREDGGLFQTLVVGGSKARGQTR
jgi:ribosomal protein S27E